MAVVERKIDKALDQSRRVQGAVQRIGILARAAGQSEINDLANVADDSITPVIGKLFELGAREADSGSYALEIPLSALAPPQLRELEERLKGAAGLADAVDALRGRSGADGLGCDLGEQLRELLYRVQLDLYGPDCGGRE